MYSGMRNLYRSLSQPALTFVPKTTPRPSGTLRRGFYSDFFNILSQKICLCKCYFKYRSDFTGKSYIAVFRNSCTRTVFQRRIQKSSVFIVYGKHSVSCNFKENSACTEDDINAFCQKLPRYKRPHKIIFAEVPRNPTGKIEKPKLRQIYCGESLVSKQIKN